MMNIPLKIDGGKLKMRYFAIKWGRISFSLLLLYKK
jgi:hypothetical protein